MDKEIHIAGNSVLDLPLRYVTPNWGDAQDGWGSNVQFLAEPIEAVLGGCGAATAYMLGKLGASVSLNTPLGEDAWGQMIRRWFDEADVQLVGQPASATAVNVIAMQENGHRNSMYYTGEKVQWHWSQEVQSSWFFASGYGQADQSDLEALMDVMTTQKRQGAKVAFDPSPWFMSNVERELIEGAWALVDVLVGTSEELNHWLQCDMDEELVRHLLNFGPELVVIKKGAEGAVFGSRESNVDSVDTEPVASAYTVGAGDTFNAGLLYALSQGETVKESVGQAVRLATKAVSNGRGVLGASQ